MYHDLDFTQVTDRGPRRRGWAVTPYVAVGAKDVYDLADRVAAAEYRMVRSYHDRPAVTN